MCALKGRRKGRVKGRLPRLVGRGVGGWDGRGGGGMGRVERTQRNAEE
jgi:hypothetical protein